MTGSSRAGRTWIVAGAAVAVFGALRLAALTRYPLWLDETWTLDVGRSGFAAAMRRYADDQTHPPLFYAMLWVWTRIGPATLAWWRLLPCLAGIATAVPVVLLARAAGFSARATWLAVLLCAGSGMLVAYSAELRDYSLLALFGTASLAAWLRARDAEGSSGLRSLTVVNALLAYSHYFGLFVIAAEWCDAALWARRRLKAFTISALLSVAALLPWVAETVRRAALTGHRLDVLSWLRAPTFDQLLDLPLAALGASPWLAADLVVVTAVGAAVALWAWRSRGSDRMPAIRLMALAVAIPVGVSYVVSVVGPHPMWLDRYFIATVPPMLLLAAGALDALTPRAAAPTALLVACSLAPAVLTMESLADGRERPRYDLVVSALLAREGMPPDTLFAGGPFDVRPLAYATTAARPAGRTTVLLVPPDSIAADSGWYVWSEQNPPAGAPPPAVLIRRGYAVSDAHGFGARDSLAMVRFARAVPQVAEPVSSPRGRYTDAPGTLPP